MTDTTAPTMPPIGKRLTLETAALARVGDLISATHRGKHYFGTINEIVVRPDVFEGSHIAGAGMAGPVTSFTFLGRPLRNGWTKFNGVRNPIGDAMVEVHLVTGAQRRGKASDFGDIAWNSLISHIRPALNLPTPSTTAVAKAIDALAVFASVVDCYSEQEDDSFEIWLDRSASAIGGPRREVFQLKAYRAAKEAMDLLKGPAIAARDANAAL